MTGMRKYMELVEQAAPAPEFLQALDMYLYQNWRDLTYHAQEFIRDAFMRGMPEIPAVIGYRGISVDDLGALDAGTDFINRQELVFEDFTSIADDAETAEMFMNAVGKRHRILFKIRTKPGNRGIVVADYEHLINRPDDDFETILEPGLRFRVAGAQRKPGPHDPDVTYYKVELEQI